MSSFVFDVIHFSEVEKALEKQKTKKDKGKKSKKKGESNDSLSVEGKKKTDDSSKTKSRTSTLKKLANSLNSSGPPPEPPARPTPKEQSLDEEAEKHPSHPSVPNVPVMSNLVEELGKKSGTLKKTTDKGNVPSNKQDKKDLPPRFTPENLHKRPPAPLPSNYQQQQKPEQSQRPFSPTRQENGTKHFPLIPSQAPRKSSAPQSQNKPLPVPPHQVLQKSLSNPPPPPPSHNKRDHGPPVQDETPKEQEQQDTQLSKKTKPVKAVGRPSPAQAKSSDSTNPEGAKPRSPVPRPRNRPPPPPPPAPLQDTGKSTSNSSLSSGDVNFSESSCDGPGPSPKPRPVPRPRQRGEQQSTSVDQEQGTLSPAGKESNNARQPPVKARPAHPPPSIPDSKRHGSSNSVISSHQQVNTPGTKPTSPGPRPTPTKPKPPLKPNIARKPKTTPPSSEPDPNLPPQVNEILQLSHQGQTKVKEILSLTDARVMDDSQNNLLEVIDELKRISLEVLETSSSLTDSLGPQARFRVRRTVTDLENKYSDMQGVVETVGQNPNAVDMERIGKAVNSFSGALDSVCTTVRATAS